MVLKWRVLNILRFYGLASDYKLNFGDVIDIDNNAFDFVQQEKQENKTLAEIMSNEDAFQSKKKSV